MPEDQGRNAEGTQELIRQMSAGVEAEVVDKRIPFASQDVLEYIRRLRRFRKESRQIEITIG